MAWMYFIDVIIHPVLVSTTSTWERTWRTHEIETRVVDMGPLNSLRQK